MPTTTTTTATATTTLLGIVLEGKKKKKGKAERRPKIVTVGTVVTVTILLNWDSLLEEYRTRITLVFL
jgi:hypothetical protein